MRTLKQKKLGVLVGAIFAISILSVASASASQFTASALGTLHGDAIPGKGGIQIFTINAGTITCTTATSEGEIKSTASEEIEVTVDYSSCTALGSLSVDVTPATFRFTASGGANIQNEITITVTGGIFGNCTVKVPLQSVNSVGFSNLGSTAILVTANVSGIKYAGSGGLCGSGTATNGTYTGQSEWIRKGGGSLRFDP
jgi:hypothetical protein